MRFSTLALSFQRLEDTSGRIARIEILAEIFRTATAEEIAPTVYLLQGRLAPAFVPLEMGLGPQNVATAVAQAYQVDRAEVLALYDRTGDLGTAAAALAPPTVTTEQPEPLDLRALYQRLLEIAGASGSGSTQQKVSAFAALLALVNPLSARYLCRIPLGTLRLGIGDVTVLDAFSLATQGDRKLRPRLERAYNETSDLGLIGTTLWSGGPEAVDALTVTAGRPVRPMLAERLPDVEAILSTLGPCAIENKYDGFRCQIHKLGDTVKIFSRNLEELTDAFPEIVVATRQQVRADDAIFEGEALAYNPLSDEYLPFQQTMRRRRKHGVDEAAAALPLRLFAFDLLYLNGRNVMPEPYISRREHLSRLLASGDTILTSESQIVDDSDALTALFNDAITNGLEGIMAKRPDSPYQAGARNYNWVKLKRAQSGHLRDTVDCVIVGYLYGRGRRAALGVGALLVAVYDPDRDIFPTITKIGTGLSDREWEGIRERCAPFERDQKPARVESRLIPSVWVEPSVVVEVLADEITCSPLYTAGAADGEQGYALRFPRLIAFRDDDKRPEDATTVREIVELYRQQGARPEAG